MPILMIKFGRYGAMIRFKLLSLIGALTLCFCAAVAHADCMDPSAEEGFRNSDFIFEGELICSDSAWSY